MPEFDHFAREYAKLLRDPIRDAFAPQGAFFMERKWHLLMEFLRKYGLSPAQSRWLDVGCGQGDLLKIGAGSFSEAAGCDLSGEMLQGCRGLNVRRQLEPGRLPFETGQFDLVTAVCVYHHVKPCDRPALTADLGRVLKAGGIACIIEHNPFNPATRIIVNRTPVDADAQLLTAGKARRIFRSAGLEIVRTRYFLYFPERVFRKFGFLENWMAGFPGGGQYAVFARKGAGD